MGDFSHTGMGEGLPVKFDALLDDFSGLDVTLKVQNFDLLVLKRLVVLEEPIDLAEDVLGQLTDIVDM